MVQLVMIESVPNGATLTFDDLNDFPTAGGQVEEDEPYTLIYGAAYQSLRDSNRTDTYVYRMLIGYDPGQKLLVELLVVR